MKNFYLLKLAACGLFLTGCSHQADSKKKEGEKPSEQKANRENVSYALGYNFGEVLVKTDETLNLDELVNGLKAAFSQSQSPRMSDTEIKNTLMMYNIEISKTMREKQEKLKHENLAKGQSFVSQYEKKSGVLKDESGLMYKIIQKGNGNHPQMQDVVKVDYTGKKVDGDVFFSTTTLGQPAKFSIANVISGWQAALLQMPVGSTWEIVVPPELAYGDRGASDVIGPGETLIFEMTLREIMPKDHSGDLEE